MFERSGLPYPWYILFLFARRKRNNRHGAALKAIANELDAESFELEMERIQWNSEAVLPDYLKIKVNVSFQLIVDCIALSMQADKIFGSVRLFNHELLDFGP